MKYDALKKVFNTVLEEISKLYRQMTIKEERVLLIQQCSQVARKKWTRMILALKNFASESLVCGWHGFVP